MRTQILIFRKKTYMKKQGEVSKYPQNFLAKFLILEFVFNWSLKSSVLYDTM